MSEAFYAGGLIFEDQQSQLSCPFSKIGLSKLFMRDPAKYKALGDLIDGSNLSEDPTDAQKGGASLCAGHSHGFRRYQLVQHCKQKSQSARQHRGQYEEDDDARQEAAEAYAHAELLKHLTNTPTLETHAKRMRHEPISGMTRICMPPVLHLTGLPIGDKDGISSSFDSKEKLKEKFREASDCFPVYEGPPPFKGRAALIFKSPDDDNVTAFENAQKWVAELNQGSNDSLLKDARLEFVTKEMLEGWQADAKNSRAGPKKHWTNKLFREVNPEKVQYKLWTDAVEEQSKRRTAAEAKATHAEEKAEVCESVHPIVSA